ncbi:leucine-rich repeat flightless-interacting protein 2 isoform X7 [Ictalurus furcatus]|uniref:leucine-rich repeat flightless-interacting protein 2 isoform X7 n=1 Tax=Ictalurus furcatus TaxID=66913 RepID=UPI0023506E52|nr:leucine-rich repeat flightless-interacting protein 2 isoform X7 [Ictalurus furcatus]
MGTQVTGRKRIPNREKVSAEDDALSQIAREAEARLAAKRAARAEAREIRLKELERQQKEISDDEERMSVGSRGSLRPTDYGGFLGSSSRTSSRASSARASPVVEERSDFLEKGSRTASTLSAATLASLGGGFSRRGSCDTSISVDTEASIRDIKDSLVEAEEKYRKAMVSNAQLDNEKSNLMYQVDTLRDTLMELEELLYETRRECEVKTKECDRERHAHSVLQFQFDEMKETLKQNEELLKKHGISLGSEVTTNGETGSNMTNGPERVESAQDTPALSSDSVLEIRLRKLVDERESLLEQVRKLKAVVEQKQRNGTNEAVSPHEEDLQNSLDSHIIDLQRDANRQISDLKFKLVKSEQEVAALEQNIIRLEGQVTRYKTASEAAEKVEDELKVEKRKLQRELRSALDRIDELEASNCHLSKRVEKMKANRNAMLSQQ